MGNIYNKSNFIELKTLQYYFEWDIKKARDVYEIRHFLKSDGFELFIKLYLEKLDFKMKKWIAWQRADGGIDLKWSAHKQKIYIQCKKYIKNHLYKWKINVWEIRNFFWWIVGIDGNFKNALKIFVNTGHYTDHAKKFAKDNNIEIWDYKDIASICEVYNYSDFKKDLKVKGFQIEDYISSYQSGIYPVQESELDEDDIYLYLSNIREKLAETYTNDSQVWFIYKNETLRIFAKNRPQNLNALKEIWKLVDDSRIDIYWREIIRWLNLLKI